jgi:hypothetical protein
MILRHLHPLFSSMPADVCYPAVVTSEPSSASSISANVLDDMIRCSDSLYALLRLCGDHSLREGLTAVVTALLPRAVPHITSCKILDDASISYRIGHAPVRGSSVDMVSL